MKRTTMRYPVQASMLGATTLGVVLLGGVAPTGLTAQDPVAVAAERRVAEIDEASLMRDLRVLAHDSMAGRLVGSDGSGAARRYIVSRLQGLGIQVDTQTFEFERAGATVTGVNVAGTIRGRVGEPGEDVLVLTAHYDHLGVREGEVFNGADDNASGTAALLAIAEALRDRPIQREVSLVFLDAEEGGLNGARAFVERVSRVMEVRDAVALNVNLDMVSRSESELWVAGTYQNPALRRVVEAVPPADGVVLRFGHDGPEWTGSDNWSGASDHAAFDRAGVPFLYFGVEDHPDYHRSTDDSERVDPAWYRASVETILRVVRALDGSPEAISAARAAKAGG
jgi:acetylornithine deacetylase/succinyl-diaminopimelate desuccinylase-like protein